MTAWSRAVLPASLSPLRGPEALKSGGGTGKIQSRSPLTLGFGWEETYPALDTRDATVAGWLAQVNSAWLSGSKFTLQHLSYQTQKGAGGGTPLINGASQTGASIATDGWPNSTTVLRAGDLVKLGALNFAQMVTADAVTNGSGQVALQLFPLIVAGQSPADNASVLYGANVSLQAMLLAFDPGLIGPDQFLTGLRLAFQETL